MIVVLLAYLGFFYWCCFTVGQIVIAIRSPEGTRLKRSAIYWTILILLVAASFLHPISGSFFGGPVLMIALLPVLFAFGAGASFA